MSHGFVPPGQVKFFPSDKELNQVIIAMAGQVVAAAASAVPTATMFLGMNLAGIATYDGAYQFNNILWNTGRWTLQSGGPAEIIQSQGTLQVLSLVGTAIFNLYVSDQGIGLSAGNYTVLNPNHHNVGLGTFGLQEYTGGYFSATSAVATYVSGGMFLSLKVTQTGTYADVGVILPGQKAAYQAGNYFSPDFLNWYSAMQSPVLRTMDWEVTNYNIDTDYVDRPVLGKTTLCTVNNKQAQAPWELVIAAANKLNKDVWINIPVRYTQDAVSKTAALFAGTLKSNLKVWLEVGNEIWNTNGPFQAGFNWVDTLGYTKLVATVDPVTGTLTKVAHGLANQDILQCFEARSSREKGIGSGDGPAPGNYYIACWGRNAYVSATGADTFKLNDSAGAGGVQIAFPTGVSELIYIKSSEAGKVHDRAGNYGSLFLRNVAAFDAAMGASRVIAVVGGQAANTAIASGILSAPAVAARANYVAIAPYVYPFWLGGAVDVTSGFFTPKIWSNANSSNVLSAGVMTAHFGVYTLGSTPTDYEVKNGLGAGFVAHAGPWTQSYTGATYAAGSAVAVVNGTNYTCAMLFIDALGYTHRIDSQVNASTVAATVNFLDTYANQQRRCVEAMDHPVKGAFDRVEAHKTMLAASSNPNLKLVNYEGGIHLDETAPAAIATWMIGFTEDVAFGNFLKKYVNGLAAESEFLHCVFADVSTGSLSWSTGDTYADTADARFTAMKSYAGFVPINTLVNPTNATGNWITQSTVNALIYNLGNPTRTHSIVKGNDEANYTISTDSTLRMISDVNVGWASRSTHTITIWSRDNFTDGIFNVAFDTGLPVWYETDALFAWNSSIDTTPAQINPQIGGVIPASGSAAVVTAGLWQNGTTSVYNSNNGTIATADLATKSFLLATVANKGTVGNFVGGVRLGVSPLMQLMVTGGNTMNFDLNSGVNDSLVALGSADAVTRVYWYFYDKAVAKAYYGNGQTINSPGGLAGSTPVSGQAATYNQFMDFASTTGYNYGTTEIVNRAGMSIGDALAIVQKIQNVHGI